MRVLSYHATENDGDAEEGNKIRKYSPEVENGSAPIQRSFTDYAPTGHSQGPATMRVTIEVQVDIESERKLRAFIDQLCARKGVSSG